MQFIDDKWMVYAASDPIPSALLYSVERVNLCLRCGVRIWSEDMQIHDNWHEELNVHRN